MRIIPGEIGCQSAVSTAHWQPPVCGKFHGDADRGSVRSSLPTWVNPQLAALVKTAPDGPDWLHEIKLNGYRMHARRDAGRAKILTRRGNDWTEKCPSIAKALTSLQAD